jgi:hypothetical protein
VTRNITVKFLEAWNKLKKNCILVAMARSAILNVINTPKASTHYGKYSYDIGCTNVATVTIKTKKGDLKEMWIPFITLHDTL